MIFSDQIHAGIAVDILHVDIHDFLTGCGNSFADVIGTDGKLTVSAVNEDGKLDSGRSAVAEQRFDGGADRTSGIDDIVNEDNGLSLNVDLQRFVFDHRGVRLRKIGAFGQIVAVHRDIERIDPDIRAVQVKQIVVQNLRHRNAAAVDADQTKIGTSLILFDNFVCNTDQCAIDGVFVHQCGFDNAIVHEGTLLVL